jgi:signal transduction histidine kinase
LLSLDQKLPLRKAIIFITSLVCLLACQRKHVPDIVNESSDFKKAEALWSQQKIDSAFYYFDRTATVSNDSLEVAMAYNYMASIQTDAGDYYGAQESLISSLKYLDERNKEHHYCLSSDYNELGMTSSKLGRYDNAIDYFDLALRFSADKDYRLIFLNNKANALREQGAYKQALKLYEEVLRNISRDGKQFARLLTNMANTRWLRNKRYNAAPELLQALHIREHSKDLWGQNSSYAHLSEYYARLKPDSGLYYAKKMHLVARKLNSPNDELYALKRLIKLSADSSAKRYFARYEQLDDSLQTARSAAKNQFALIRYHSEKSKAENLKLQKENSDRQYQLIQQRIRFYGLVGAFGLMTLLAARWYKIRKHRLEADKQEAIMEEQRRTSKKVHDTLANDLYRIMKTVQYNSEPGRDWLVDNLDHVYQRARDLSYTIVNDAQDFELKLSALLKSFASDSTRVVLVGNSCEFWQKVTATAKIELKYILQELMVNMQKHSQATDVVVRFEQLEDHLRITYKDNGLGMPAKISFNNGLTNTGNRIEAINGKLTFDSTAGKGLQIDITFPFM